MRARPAHLSILTAGVVSALAVTGVPAAFATDADAQFLSVVAELGLQFATPDDAVEAGNNVCDIVAEGDANNVGAAEIRGSIVKSLLGEGVTEDQAKSLMIAAVSAYCPIYNGIVAG